MQKFMAVVCVILCFVCVGLAKEVIDLRDRVAVFEVSLANALATISATTKAEAPHQPPLTKLLGYDRRLNDLELQLRQLDSPEGRVRLLEADRRSGRGD